MHVSRIIADLASTFSPARAAETLRRMCHDLGDGSPSHHTIECDGPPKHPCSELTWRVAGHVPHGRVVWNPLRVRLYRPLQSHMGHEVLSGDVIDRLSDKPVVNSNVLDFLLTEKHLVPETWHDDREVSILFPGTRFANQHDATCVRTLRRVDTGWCGDLIWLDLPWRREYLVALFTS